jgi:hypothetical protein
VTILRRLFRQRPVLMALVLACALLMRVAVPGGYMVALDHGALSIVECPGMVAAPAEPAMHGMHHAEPDTPAGHARPDQPCAFAGLAAPTLAAADAVLLAGAIAFVMLLWMRPRRADPVRRVRQWRPPSRAPPLAFPRP